MTSHCALNDAIARIATPLLITQAPGELKIQEVATLELPLSPEQALVPAITPKTLGDPAFKQRHGLVYPYLAGAMANGISSTALVKTMAENGMVGFFGAGGLRLDQIEAAIISLKQTLQGKPMGFNLIHSLGDPAHEMATVKLYLRHGIHLISAAAFMRITLPLVYFRIKGIHKDSNGKIVTPNRIIAKVSRIEIAKQFFAPPPEKLVNALLESGDITASEAALAKEIPMAQDITAEADSGGHTDNRPALTLLPTLIALKHQCMATYGYKTPLCVGLAGGIATPESAAAAFSMGAAYILTGSINQSCVEAGVCEDVRQLLCQTEQADVAMAPAADMFEIGAKVQVLKRGTLFSVRAEKLYHYYKNFNCFEDLPEKARTEIQKKLLLTDFESAWQSTRQFFLDQGNTKTVEKGDTDPKHKMALVFRSYLGQSSRWAIQGIPHRRMDYQIWCGPAMGAFNQWVHGTFMASHQHRFAAEIALNLLFGACVCTRTAFLNTQGIVVNGPSFSPMKMEQLSALF